MEAHFHTQKNNFYDIVPLKSLALYTLSHGFHTKITLLLASYIFTIEYVHFIAIFTLM